MARSLIGENQVSDVDFLSHAEHNDDSQNEVTHKFIWCKDLPFTTYSGHAGESVVINNTADGLDFVTPSLLSLADVPNDYKDGYYLRSTVSGFVFYDTGTEINTISGILNDKIDTECGLKYDKTGGVISGSCTITESLEVIGDIIGLNLSGTNTGDQPLISGTVVGQMSFWDGTKWTYTDETQLKWNSTTGYQEIDGIQFDTTITLSGNSIGLLRWNSEDDALEFGISDDAIIQIGQETVVKVKNISGFDITNGAVVYPVGAIGDNPAIGLAKADVYNTTRPIGLATEFIGNNAVGFVTLRGRVRGLDTTVFNEGDIVYVSASVAGGITNIKPSYPNKAYRVGVVLRKHATEGIIMVDSGNENDIYQTGSILFANGGGEVSEDNSNFFWDNINNRLGIGTAVPTAKLHLPAGTSASGTAPLKFTSGTALTTPETGVMEFHDNRLYFTNVGHRRSLDRTSDVVISSVSCQNTTDETTLWVGELDADDLKVGNILKVEGYGQISSDSASDICTLRIYIGSTLIGSIDSPGKALSLDCWGIEFKAAVRSIGASGVLARYLKMEIEADENRTYGTITIDTTINENVVITAQWNSAKAGNIIGLGMGWLEYKN